jgi:hypothetical protein
LPLGGVAELEEHRRHRKEPRVFLHPSVNFRPRFRIFILGLVAALSWTAVAAEPAEARHARGRPFSIASSEPAFFNQNTPKVFTCYWVHGRNASVHDYRCERRSFSAMLVGSEDASIDDGSILMTGGDANEKTPVVSPPSFKCERGNVAMGNRRPSDYSCTTNTGKRFKLSDVAFVRDEKNEQLVYALPCAKRNCAL